MISKHSLRVLSLKQFQIWLQPRNVLRKIEISKLNRGKDTKKILKTKKRVKMRLRDRDFLNLPKRKLKGLDLEDWLSRTTKRQCLPRSRPRRKIDSES